MHQFSKSLIKSGNPSCKQSVHGGYVYLHQISQRKAKVYLGIIYEKKKKEKETKESKENRKEKTYKI